MWSACFRRQAHRCNMHSFCRSSQRSVSRCKLVVKIKCVVRGCRNLKRWARKRFPPSPCRGAPPHNPLPKNNECYIPLSGGLRGQPFAQHCSCPIVLRCSVNLTMAAFWGTIHVYESCFLAQWLVSHRTHQQGGVVTPPESFAYQDKPGTLSPCGAERKTGSKTCATSSSSDRLR